MRQVIQENQKTEIRYKLEMLEEAIKNSWLRDLDKTKEMNELIHIQELMLTSPSIASFFENNQSDFEYFSTKFSHEVINNIKLQPAVYGENGDDIALNILNNYLLLWLKFHKDSTCIPLWDEVREIFSPDASYFKASLNSHSSYINPKKMFSADRFNDKLPHDSKINFKVGDECDVLIDYKKSKNQIDQKAWVRGKIISIKNEYYTITTKETTELYNYKIGGLNVLPVGTATKDWEWRRNLKPYDVIDCYDRGTWYPSTILDVQQEESNEGTVPYYRIGFRLYVEMFSDWKKYVDCWNNGDYIRTDSRGQKIIGDAEQMDETIAHYSKRIQMRDTKVNPSAMKNSMYSGINNNSYYYRRNVISEDDYSSVYADLFFLYKDPSNGKKYYIIGKGANFSYYYAMLLNNFAISGGFEEIIKILTDKPSSDEVLNAFSIFKGALGYLHKDFFVEFREAINSSVFKFINELSANEMRNLKKDLIDLITEVLTKIKEITAMPNDQSTAEMINELTISISLKMIKTSIFDKRLQGVKTLNDYIKSNRNNEIVLTKIIKQIKENEIINEIFGPNSHSQIISKVNDIIELLLDKDQLTEDDIKLILSGTQKGDLEGKLTILNLIKELSSHFKPKQIDVLLNNIYSHIDPDISITEIDLVYDLSSVGENEDNIDKCITFFTNCLLNSKSTEDEKKNQIITKLINITNKGDKYIKKIIDMCVDCIKSNKHSILAFDILNKYLFEMNNREYIAPMSELIQDNKLLNIFIDNFKAYKTTAKEISEKKGDLNNIDGLSHFNNLRLRCEFLKVIIQLYEDFDFIQLLIEILLTEPVLKEDKDMFFQFIHNLLTQNDNDKVKKKIVNEIFELFDKKSELIGEITNHAFFVYVSVFIGINQQKGYLTKLPSYNDKPNDLSSITLQKNADELVGFDILWNLIFESTSDYIMNQGIEIVNTLFKKNDEMNKLLTKCTSLIQSGCESIDKANIKNIQKIKKCLTILTLILKESEIEGTGGIKSHFSLCKRGIIPLHISVRTAPDLSLTLYQNTTISDLISICANKLKLPSKFIELQLKSNQLSSSVKTIYELNSSQNEDIVLSYNAHPQADLIDKLTGEPVPSYISIINDWFDMFSEEKTRMTPETCASFVSSVTTNKESVGINDNRVRGFMERYDKERKGYISRDDFVQFYVDSAKSKPSIVWENLNAMNIRYDLKLKDDPIDVGFIDKTKLPRYTLGNDLKFINTMFDIYQKVKGSEVEEDVYQFIFDLYTNEEIYNGILYHSNEDIINKNNLIKSLYEMQIIESFIEDIELKDNKVDNDLYLPFDDDKNDKVKWIEDFMLKKKYQEMIKRLEELFDMVGTGEKIDSILIKCLESGTKIIKHFYKASISDIPLGNDITTNKIQKRSSIEKQFPSSIPTTMLSSLILSLSITNEDLINKEDYLSLSKKLLHFLSSITQSDEISLIAMYAFEFLFILLTHHEIKEIDNEIQTSLKTLIRTSLTYHNKTMQKFFFKTLYDCTMTANEIKNYDFILFIYSSCSSLFNEIQIGNNDSKTNDTNEVSSFSLFFDFFSVLYEIVNTVNIANTSSDKESENFLIKIYESIYDDLTNKKTLSIELFIGFMKILTKASENSDEIRDKLFNHQKDNENVLRVIIDKLILNQSSNKTSLPDNSEYISIDQVKTSNKSRITNSDIKPIVYSFVLSMIRKSDLCIELFINLSSMAEKEEVVEDDFDRRGAFNLRDNNHRGNQYYYNNRPSGKSEDHVGLKNLGCICYMNSIMQQMYMVPTFRFAIMSSDDKEPQKLDHGIDDNVLHQLQRMYTYLFFSEKEYYNPKEFCFSFKDFDGNPTNTMVQQDSQEFLNAFCDKIENSLKNTNLKYIINNVFVGRTCSQVICDACGNVSNRFEDFYNLTLEVANMKTLNDSLNKLILPEKIDDFNCERCGKKVTITKRTSLCDLPNVLILHLKRFYMNYDIEHTEKNNSKLEFPLDINLKKFCIEELMHQTSAGYETDEIYYKDDEYYEYELKGVNVHMGSADGGHYYSFIDVNRDGKGNEISFDKNSNWLKFNDSSVSKFDISNLPQECYGGSNENNNGFHYENCQNAYLLVYERKKKTPLKIVVDINKENKEGKTIIEYKDDERNKIKKVFDISRKNVNPSETESNATALSIIREGIDMSMISKETIKKELASTIFYDTNKNEYFKYVNFYDMPKMVPTKYYKEVIADNSRFEKIQNNDDSFSKFYDMISVHFNNYLANHSLSLSNLSSTIDIVKLCNMVMKNTISMIEQIEWNLSQSKGDDAIRVNNYISFISQCVRSDRRCVDIFTSYIGNDKNFSQVFALDDSYISFIKEVASIVDYIITTTINDENNFHYAHGMMKCVLGAFNRQGKDKQYPLFDLLEKVISLLDDSSLKRLYIDKYIPHLLSPIVPNRLNNDGYYMSSNIDIVKKENKKIVDVVYYLIKRTKQFNSNENIDDSHKTEKDKPSFDYFDEEFSDFKNSQLLNVIFKLNFDFFIDLMKIIQNDDQTFDESMMELCDLFDRMDLNNEENTLKIFTAMIEMVNIKDKFQFKRYTILLGYPTMIIDETGETSNLPLFGKKIMKSKNDNYLKYTTINHIKESNCVLSKIVQFDKDVDKDKAILFVKIMMLLLTKAKKNYTLFKYLYLMPCRSLQYDNVYDEIVEKIKMYIEKITAEEIKKQYSEDIVSIVAASEDYITKVKEDLSKQSTNEEIEDDWEMENDKKEIAEMQWFKGFKNNYIPGDIVREEISFICEGERLVLLRIEYYTTIIPIDQLHPSKTEITFDDNTSTVEEKEQIEEAENIGMIDIKLRNGNEKEYTKEIGQKAKIAGKKIVLVNPELKDKKCYNTLIRYVVTNGSSNNGVLNLTINSQNKALSLYKPKNYFIPERVRDNINGMNYKDIFLVYIFNYELPTVESKFICVNIDIKFNNQNQMQNYGKYNNFR